MIDEILKNKSILSITPNKGVNIEKETINAGTPEEKTRFIISGRSTINESTEIGVIKISAAKNKRFLKAPSVVKSPNQNITLSSSLRLKLDSIERDSNNSANIYNYKLMYTSKETTSKINRLKYTLSNRTVNVIDRGIPSIKKVSCGSSHVNNNGEKRYIVIHGDPNATFKIAMLSVSGTYNESIDGINLIKKQRIGMLAKDILNTRIANSTLTNVGMMDETSIIDGKIGSNGRFSFSQQFPKVTDADLTTNGLGGYVLLLLPTKLKTSRLRGFNKNVDNAWDGWYSKGFRQTYIAKTTLRATTNNVLYTINQQAIPGGASSQTYDKVYRGVSGSSKGSVRSGKHGVHTHGLEITYILRALSSSHSFSALKSLSYSSSGGTSDWSNTNRKTNGGLHLEFENISVTLSNTQGWSNDTATISFNITAKDWGTEDNIVSMALNTIVGCS